MIIHLDPPTEDQDKRMKINFKLQSLKGFSISRETNTIGKCSRQYYSNYIPPAGPRTSLTARHHPAWWYNKAAKLFLLIASLCRRAVKTHTIG